MKNLRKYLNVWASRYAIYCLRWYQHTFSPDHGPAGEIFGNWRCRFHPSCSAYTAEAIRQYGFLKGSVVSLKRISKCHPWNPGGYDPL